VGAAAPGQPLLSLCGGARGAAPQGT